MKYGYSMLLSDAVDASELSYGDCEEFLVVCPACREGLFKKIRKRDGLSDTHYLSHFVTTPETMDCEIRVSKMTMEEVRLSQGSDQGQTIEGFTTAIEFLIIDSFTTKGKMIEGFSVEDTLRKTLINPNFNYVYRQFREWQDGLRNLISDKSLVSDLSRVSNPMLAPDVKMDLGIALFEVHKPVIAGHISPFTFKIGKKYITVASSFATNMDRHLLSHHGYDSQRLLIAALFSLFLEPNLSNPNIKSFIKEAILIHGDKRDHFDGKAYNASDDLVIESLLSLVRDLNQSKMRFTRTLSKTNFDTDIRKYLNTFATSDEIHLSNSPKQIKGTIHKIHTLVLMRRLYEMLLTLIPVLPSGRKHFGKFGKALA